MPFKLHLQRLRYKLRQALPAIASVLAVVFILTCGVLYHTEGGQGLSLELGLDIVLLALLYSVIICLPHSITCCFLGNILYKLSFKRSMYYYLGNTAVFFILYLIAISIWKWIPYLTLYPAASDSINPHTFFTAYDSMAYFLRYAILYNLLYAAEFALIFTLFMLALYYIRYLFKRLFG